MRTIYRIFAWLGLALWSTATAANDDAGVRSAADAAFPLMPAIETVPSIDGTCGADSLVHPWVAYCTSQNTVLLAEAAPSGPARQYLLAHAYGHAVQVRHGVADVALREIRNRPEDEQQLRGYVERQVDCIAGFILSHGGIDRPDLAMLFDGDPLDRPHWGRDPLRRGPHLAVPIADRAMWLEKGYTQGLAACAVGEFPADLLIAARR